VTTALSAYDARLQEARRGLDESPALARLFDDLTDADLIEAFLIQYCAIGVGMTRPVEDWLRRAGERCVALGFGALGQSLIEDARSEAGHHNMMINDTLSLVTRWNGRRGPHLDPLALIERPTPGVRRYADVHAAAIDGEHPFAQLAIEFEIEQLSGRYGPRLIGQIARRLGPAVVGDLSFVRQHVELDVDHAAHGAERMERFLTEHPGQLEVMATAGAGALVAYRMFLEDCLREADAIVRS
jgi:hypothetical protein